MSFIAKTEMFLQAMSLRNYGGRTAKVVVRLVLRPIGSERRDWPKPRARPPLLTSPFSRELRSNSVHRFTSELYWGFLVPDLRSVVRTSIFR